MTDSCYSHPERLVIVLASRLSEDDGDYHPVWVAAIYPDDLHELRVGAGEACGEWLYETPRDSVVIAAIRDGVPSRNISLGGDDRLLVDDQDDDAERREIEHEVGVDVYRDD